MIFLSHNVFLNIKINEIIYPDFDHWSCNKAHPYFLHINVLRYFEPLTRHNRY